MKMSEWIKGMAECAADPECCSLPDDDDFSPASLALAIIGFGSCCRPGKFGYLQQLGNDPEVIVARDALSMLKPAHPGSEAAAEDGEAWKNYAAEFAAWQDLRNAFPRDWLAAAK